MSNRDNTWPRLGSAPRPYRTHRGTGRKSSSAWPTPPAARRCGRSAPPASPPGSVRLGGCEVDTQKGLRTGTGQDGWGAILLFADGGPTLLSAGHDGTLRRWRWDSGQEVPLPDGYSQVSAIAGPGGRVLAVGVADGRL